MGCWQELHPAILHNIHDPWLGKNVVIHVTQYVELRHDWQFEILLQRPVILVWQSPFDDNPHGVKQKLHVELFCEQYKQLYTLHPVLLIDGL